MTAWYGHVLTYAAGDRPEGLVYAAPDRSVTRKPRDVFAYFITGGKVNAPAGAVHLQSLLET